MWKNIVENAFEDIILHDCVAQNAELLDNTLSLHFKNGFWLIPENRLNKSDTILATKESCVKFCDILDDSFECQVYQHFKIFGKYAFSRRNYIDLDKFIGKLNSGEWKLEFVEEYKQWKHYFYSGFIETKKCQSKFEFSISLLCEKIEYCWNEENKERVW